MAAFDRFAIERCSVPSLLLMENAGRGAAELIERRLAVSARVLVVCGSGNNGGDGFVVARHLLCAGRAVRVVLFAKEDQLTPDARANLGAWRGVGGEVVPCTSDAELARFDECSSASDAIVDALFGTGLTRDVAGRFLAAIERINQRGLPVFALDIPSGLSADTGLALGAAIKATLTVTFGHYKLGLLTSKAPDFTGELALVGLGVPASLEPAQAAQASLLEASDVRGWLLPRSRSAHKGSAGRVLVIAGSPGKTGAALLASQAALRAGAGLVSVCSFPETAATLDPRVVEVMTERIDPERIGPSLDALLEPADAVVLGPGLGLDARARSVSEHVLGAFDGPVVVDADALSHFSGRPRELRQARGRCVLTPHPGELGRLLGLTAAEVEADRFRAIEQAVAETGQLVLLKGPYTLIAAAGFPVWISAEGEPVLAVGGSGDVLAGVIGGLAPNLSLERAAAAGAFLHGRASRLWREAHGGADRGLLARELADLVPRAFAALTRS
jgi:ADP-dependent NAD(P)H-hydrate dehydratase / NAD(P)H-hydrate epimerase